MPTAPHSGTFGEEPPDSERFEIRGRLGDGSMGIVYDAYDRETGEMVALKTVRATNADSILRFKDEFRALADLHHPNLVHLRELFEDRGRFFFTMEKIEGGDFLSYVRGSSTRQQRLESGGEDDEEIDDEPTVTAVGLDIARLRAALVQLARAVNALHQGGQIHRDVKPSNVRVTRDGRVVLLDFGLSTSTTAEASWSEQDIVGTPFYMAPEQAAAQPVGPAADWYSVGVMLYQALTGSLPFEGGTLQVLLQKQKERPKAPAEIVPGVPPALNTLCMELLATEPADRPSGGEVLRRLEERGGTGPEGARPEGARSDEPVAAGLASRPGSSSVTPPFIGRMDELAALEAAMLRTRAGRPVGAFVCGESGMGKTSLVRRFLQEVTLREPRAVVLYGRCHERESVPYKAMDGVVDALSRFMLRLPAEEAALFLPLEASLLAQVFPVLRRVRLIAQAPRRAQEILDPQELRRRVFSALRELFQRVAARRPVVLVTDDLQWADTDGLALLTAILRPPDAPAVFWLATLRDDVTLSEATRDALRDAESAVGPLRRLTLGALSPEEARELASRLLGRAFAAGAADPAVIADEAGGHPLFIDALVRHAALGGASRSPIRLEDALLARIAELEPPARTLLELAVVYEIPLPLETAARALSLEGRTLTRYVSVLRVAQLVRAAGTRQAPCIEPSHDRLRTVVQAHLDVAALRARHEALALALEGTPHADPEAKAIHWQGAGDETKAARYAIAAADAAALALAFERAVRLYAWALHLQPLPPSEASDVVLRLADALANAGRAREAAALFERAAEGAAPPVALELHRRASEQYLRSGHIDDGVRVIRSILTAVHEEFPESPASALRALALRRLHVRLRGLRFRRRDPQDVPHTALTRIDLFWSMATTLGIVDPMRGMYFQARHLLLALAAGEPSRVVRAMAMEAAYSSSEGSRGAARTARLVAKVEALAHEVGTPSAIAWSLLAKGAATLLEGRFAETLAAVEPAQALLRDRCTGVTWELSTAQWLGLWARAYRGELGSLARTVPVELREAEARGDLYGASCHRTGLANLVWLAAGDVAQARAQADEAVGRWSRKGFHVQHWWDIYARGHIALYEGSDGLQGIEERWEALRQSMLLRVQISRVESAFLRGRAAVQRAANQGGDKRLSAMATKDANLLRREGVGYAACFAASLDAGLACARGDLEHAVERLGAAERSAVEAGMSLHAAAARRGRGVLLGGDEGRELVGNADRVFSLEGVRFPERFAGIYIPGLVLPGRKPR